MNLNLFISIAITILSFLFPHTKRISEKALDGNAYYFNPYKYTSTDLPAFRLVTEDGTVVQLSDLKGKKLFVNFWATWCPPCRAELASIQKLYHSLDTTKAIFVLISLDRNFEIAIQYKKYRKMKLPVYYPAEDLPELFKIQSIPATFIFDEEGKLVQHIDGAEDYNTKQYRQLFGS